MNINIANASVAAVLLSAACVAHGQTATLNITGRITATPCSISVNAVAMGDVPISEFTASSTPASQYWKPFTVTLNACDITTLQSANLKFNGTLAYGSNTSLALTAGAGTATGFGVQVRTNDSVHGSGITVRMDGGASYPFNVNSTQNTFTFTSLYVKPVGAPAMRSGTANATATITLTYS
ncbi:fimbrial protein [Achromobacter arsenitoxydans]|uniref:fimbrial protein n=1 Tax=Achromobacter arsenitoxydans TaxID=1147684 RepID=UPI0009DAC530|nr:fimbrial protein [Achromobacter arsenitoxydans]